MLLVNAQQEVIGWFPNKKAMGELKEGDTVIKTLKDAKAQGFEAKWVELRPKKEKVEGEARTRTPAVTTGAYTVVKGEAIKNGKNAGRDQQMQILLDCNTIEDFLSKAEGYETEKHKVTPQAIVSYALKRGFIQLAA